MDHTHRVTGAACALVLTIGTAFAQTPGYHLLGGPTGYTSGGVSAVSADGRSAAGANVPPTGGNPGFVWSDTTGRYDFGLIEPFGRLAVPAAISNDGGTVAGREGGREAFRWSGLGNYQRLGYLPNFDRSSGRGISGDGSIVVGESHLTQSFFGEAFRWTQATGMQGIGFTRPDHIYSEANGISRDGVTIVGMSQSPGGSTDAFAWTQAAGMRILPLPSGPTSAVANATNHDGSVIVGRVGSVAALWSGTGVQILFSPLGSTSIATDVNDDGSVLVGSLGTLSGNVPAVWSVGMGWQFPGDYFASQGYPLPSGWSVNAITSLSSNGTTFGGAVQVNGRTEAFVLTVPAPASLALCGMMCTRLTRRQRNAMEMWS